ncbi:MAG: chromate efflux transporter [SAR202 cluster bacterium]|nr:chromate efflux transporter [SAR202 cluster bacterium]
MPGPDNDQPAPSPFSPGSLLEVFLVALRLGLTSFGGPIAHLGYFRQEYVARRRWLDERSYADIVALSQSLPGPASSKVGIIIGTLRAGMAGGFMAWLGFTLPSALALVLFAYGVQRFTTGDAGWLHGLKIAAVSVVAQAVWGMSRNLAPDRPRATIAVAAAIVALVWPHAWTQVLIIVAAGLAGWRLLQASAVQAERRSIATGVPPWVGIGALALFFGLLLGLPLLRQFWSGHWLAVVDSFYRAGSLVFGGGHVVLPLLQTEVVAPGWVTQEQFLAGYGATQAAPGPIFTFSAYLGTVMGPPPNGIIGGILALGAIFMPAFLLAWGPLPFWDILRTRPAFQSVLRGVNAAVVGLLLAALYNPVWTSAVKAPQDFALAVIALALLMLWKVPPWLVVVLAAAGGAALAALPGLGNPPWPPFAKGGIW